jgi:murein DD-endopeptidase MepM/ murein hydrolase activator NlpD
LGLDLEPRRKRRGRGLLLVIIILLIAGLIAWQQGWLPAEAEQAVNQLSQNVGQVVSAPASPPASQPTVVETVETAPTATDEIVLAIPEVEVEESPQSEAYTAELYEEANADEGIPWPSVGGRATVETYTVQEGDTLWSIASQFELDIDTLRWSNPALERNPDILSLGTELVILPVQGVYHRVSAGDTVESIAAQYGVSDADITNYPPNGLYPPYELELDQGIIVPFGSKELNVPHPSLAPDSPLAWPVAGPITQSYHEDHLAIDVGGPYGTTIYAAADGEVTYARWAETGYGYTLIIDHGEGLETWYSHLKGTLLQSGFVARGDPIGEMGSTGRSSGPHVHFEVRVNGERVNPLGYLPDSPN